MKISTYIGLPPGELKDSIINSLLELTIIQFKWINPTKFGPISPNKAIPECTIEQKVTYLKTFFESEGAIEMAGVKGTTLSIIPNRFGNKSFNGYILWEINIKHFTTLANEVPTQMITLMKLLNAPIAFSALTDAYVFYSGYTEETEQGATLNFTVKNYSCGLQNAHWRMWFGPHYSNFFGKEKLVNAPCSNKIIGDKVNFVELYKDPADWNQETGKEASRRFKEFIGKNTFFDYQDKNRILDAPDFSDLI